MSPPQLIIDDRFTYTNNQLFYAGIARYPAEDLQKLFYVPKELGPAAEELATQTLTRDFLVSQLKLYGIWFPVMGARQVLLNILRSSVSNGHCRVDERVQQIEAVLRAQWVEAVDAEAARKWQDIENYRFW